jgi:superfamily I DNA/RNA helicase
MNWSQQQERIFDWFRDGSGHLVVKARAGTGKTTTVIEGVNRAPETQILLAAFSKSIAVELDRRMANPHAEAKTLHSLGFGFVRMFWERTFIDKTGGRAYRLAELACGEDAPDAILTLVARACTLFRECAPFATKREEVSALAWKHDLIPDVEWAEYGWTEATVLGCALKAKGLAKLREHARRGIDFTDMIFLPVANNWVRPRYDLVVIDEAQDMNATQIEMAVRVASGRIAVVGDDRQAIFGFRGADSGSLGRLSAELDAEELGLTTTYRCASKIVKAAQKYVPEYRAAETNPPGEILRMSTRKAFELAAPGDAVLARLNAPLISACLRAIAGGTAARIEGRDVAGMLRNLLRKLATGKASKSVPALLARLATWEEREIDRAESSGGSGVEWKIEAIRDKAAALRYLVEGATGVKAIRGRIDDLFDEEKNGECLVFATVHKAKGLEWDRVFLLEETFRQSDAQEERNIRYVAMTRARSCLVYVGG